MEALRFIQTNFWFLLAICGAVFVFGIILMLVGNAMRRQGERRLADAQQRYVEALYPPVDPEPIYESDYR